MNAKRLKIKRYGKLYRSLFVQELKNRMSYRMDFLISIIAMVVSSVLGFFSFWIIFLNVTSIAGYSFYEMLFFYGFFLITITPAQVFFANNWNLPDKVFTGDFIVYCTKPVNTFFYFYSETYDINAFVQGVIGACALIISWNKLNIEISAGIIILLIFEIFFSSLVLIALMNLAASTSFLIINSDCLMELVNKIKDYAKYPMSIYNSLFTFIFSLILPIGHISFYPSMLFLNKTNNACYLTPVIGVGLFWISYKVWMKLARKYTGTGS